nr:uncharacterized protein LOC131781763 [Pocillopora verrucosa]
MPTLPDPPIVIIPWGGTTTAVCGRKFQQKPASSVSFQQDVTLDANGNASVSWHCAGQRTSTPQVMTNCQNIVIFSVDLLSGAGMLHINDLPPKITVQGKTFYLQAATLWNGNHYIEPAKQAIWQGEKFAQSRHAIYEAGFVQLILMVAGKCRVCRSKPLRSIRA